MANSPIQVVLNPTDFIESWERKGGGLNKDFYAENDIEFLVHKQNLSSQLSIIKESQTRNVYSDISYAKLILKPSALAKSHRPTSNIFVKNVAPVIGGGDLGELFVELHPGSIDKISKKIQQAEDETRLKKQKDGKEKPNPTSLRSEVGSIMEIMPYTASDKRKFSIKDGIEWLSNPQTGGSYIVELFDVPPPRQNWDLLPVSKFKLFKSFSDGLLGFGSGLVASRLIDSNKKTPLIGIRLEVGDSPATVQLLPIQSSAKRQDLVREPNLEMGKHTTLIKFLEDHPLVPG